MFFFFSIKSFVNERRHGEVTLEDKQELPRAAQMSLDLKLGNF